MYEPSWQTLCETHKVAQSNGNRNLRSRERDPKEMRGTDTSECMPGLTLPVRLSPCADICQPKLYTFHRHFSRDLQPIASNIVLI